LTGRLTSPPITQLATGSPGDEPISSPAEFQQIHPDFVLGCSNYKENGYADSALIPL